MTDEQSMLEGLMQSKAWEALTSVASDAINAHIGALRGKGDPWDYGYNSGVIAGMQGIMSYPARRLEELTKPVDEEPGVAFEPDDD
jgi:hypothetical protein